MLLMKNVLFNHGLTDEIVNKIDGTLAYSWNSRKDNTKVQYLPYQYNINIATTYNYNYYIQLKD